MADKTKFTAVADSSFLIGLSLIDKLDLISSLVDKLYVTEEVWDEVFIKGKGRSGIDKIKNAEFIEKHPVKNEKLIELLKVFLGAGESETLVLAQELGCSIVFLDDLRARKAAQRSGLKTIGVGGFLLAAKQKGLIDEVKPLLLKLQEKGFRLGNKLIETILKAVGEV